MPAGISKKLQLIQDGEAWEIFEGYGTQG